MLVPVRPGQHSDSEPGQLVQPGTQFAGEVPLPPGLRRGLDRRREPDHQFLADQVQQVFPIGDPVP